MNILGAESNWLADEVLKTWREKYKIEFNFLPITWDDWSQKVRIWMSSGDIPDITWVDFGPTMVKDYNAWVEAGLLKEIKGIEKYPNVVAQLDVLHTDDDLAINGKKYVWPVTKDTTSVEYTSSRGFVYRKDWVRKLGLLKENDIYTWDEMVNIARQCVAQDPGGVGKNKVAGLACTTWAWPKSLGIEQCTAGVIGGGGYYKVNGKYVWNAAAPEMLQGLKITKALYDDGTIWKDQPLCKADEPCAKFKAGEIGVLYDNAYAYQMSTFRNEMNKNLGVAFEDVAYMKVKSPNDKFTAIRDDDYWTISLFSAKMPDAKFDRLMAAWDWMLSKEGYFTRQIGIKGVDWDFDGDGVKYLWPYDETQKKYVRPADNPKFIGAACYLPMGLTEGFGFVDPNLDENKANVDATNFCKFLIDNAVYIEPDYKVAYFSEENMNKYGSFGSEIKDELIKIILNSKDVEGDWNKYLESRKDKVQLVIDELNNGIK